MKKVSDLDGTKSWPNLVSWLSWGAGQAPVAAHQSGHLLDAVLGFLQIGAHGGKILFSGFILALGGAAAGIACGILWDLYGARLLGFNALLLLVTGCLCGLLITLLMRNNLLTALLLSAAALLFVGLMNWLCYTVLLAEPEPGFILVRRILPSLAYSFVLTPLLYGGTFLTARILKRRE